MALSKFPAAFNSVTDGLLIAAEQARTIRDGTGDLRWSSIVNLIRTLGQLEANYEIAKVEAQKQLTAAQTYVADLGGPATLTEFNTLMSNVVTAKQAMLDGFDTILTGLDGTNFHVQKTLSIGGHNVTLMEQQDFIPTATSDTIRASALIANLITDLETLGA